MASLETEVEPEVEYPEPEVEAVPETSGETKTDPVAEGELSDEATLYLWICLYSVCILLIVVGNISIIYAMLRRKLLRRRPVNYFLFSLIVARASIGLLVVPARLLGLFSEEYLGSMLCKLCHHAGHTSSVTSILSTSMIAVTKYIDVVKYRGRLRFSTSQGSLGVAGVWIMGGLYAIRAPVFYDLILVDSHDGGTAYYACKIDPSFADINIVCVYLDLVLLFVLPFATIVYCYSGTIKGLKRLSKITNENSTKNDDRKPKLVEIPPPVEVKNAWGEEKTIKTAYNKAAGLRNQEMPFSVAEKPEAESDPDVQKAALRSIKMILIVASLFVVCTFIPYPFKIYTYYHDVSEAFNVCERWVYFLSYCNAWINVIVIIYFRKDIRDGLRCRASRVDNDGAAKETFTRPRQSIKSIADQMVVNIA